MSHFNMIAPHVFNMQAACNTSNLNINSFKRQYAALSVPI
ncbi:hypothetical protein HMPREF9098_1691 [Kingella denitrificans ATCC 33394]|uniref:Uncharacterized protein n=1 Tax=Kingella denitrificans ATCC 33394 TaxID=888741 RepID=F0F0Q6_9NEIS|nr:hypothetical protein HMPREF9098_1691 [Kingella denitrificans ATCC 33394]